MESTAIPYRLQVFADGVRVRKVRRYPRYTRIVFEPIHYGFDAWREEQSYQEARLPGAGSFLFPGLHSVRDAAMEYLSRPNVTQVSVRTNQGKQVYRYFRRADGTITGYGYSEGGF